MKTAAQRAAQDSINARYTKKPAKNDAAPSVMPGANTFETELDELDQLDIAGAAADSAEDAGGGDGGAGFDDDAGDGAS